MLQLFELTEGDDTAHFIGIEHPVHSHFDEFDGDISGKSPPDVISGKYFEKKSPIEHRPCHPPLGWSKNAAARSPHMPHAKGPVAQP